MKQMHVLSLLFVVSTAGGAQTSGLAGERSEENAVYAAVLAQHYKHPAGTRLLLEPTTRGPSFPSRDADVARVRSLTDAALFDEFRRRSGERVSLADGIGVPGTVLVTDSLRRAVENSPDWWVSSVGAYTFSRIAFDSTRTKALVYVFRGCGQRCGDGGLIQLERRNGQWQVRRLLYTEKS